MKRIASWSFLAACLFSCASVQREVSSEEGPQLEQAFASKAVALSLHCVDTETPHWDEGQGSAPHAEKKRHPAFYGCFDWHSAAHGHWAMLRAADVVTDLPEKAAIVATLGRHLTAPNLKAELNYLNKDSFFEAPYGWGWVLRLGEELRRSKIPEAAGWLKAITPLENRVASGLQDFLKNLSAPNRVGMHDNTAFAMIHAWDYSKVADLPDFRAFLAQRARDFYFNDHDCTLANEPGPTDFISPCFVEADLMRRVLSPAEFSAWYARLLPDVKPEQLKPVPPADLHDPYSVHLVGLMYEKSSAMLGVARTLAADDPRQQVLLDAVKAQIEMADKLMLQSDYGGTHWLASFAIYYYSGSGL